MEKIHKIVLIGSGNVATHLATAFEATGIEILQVYSYNLIHAQNLANTIGCDATDNLASINQDADLYIIAVKDDAIFELNESSFQLHDKIVVHTSGSAPLEAINHISNKTGVFYPLQTFSKSRPVNWQTVPLCIEASAPDIRDMLHDFAATISNSKFDIDSVTRRQLHLAAVFASNFTNYMLGASKEIIGENLPFKILKPLVQETVAKAFDLGPVTAQTGPALRHDKKTMAAHMKLLEDKSETRELYRLISDLIGKKNPSI